MGIHLLLPLSSSVAAAEVAAGSSDCPSRLRPPVRAGYRPL